METYDMHIYVHHPFLASITPFHSLFLKFQRLPNLKFETSSILYLPKFSFLGKLCNAHPELEQRLKMEKRTQFLPLIRIRDFTLQFFSSKSLKQLSSKELFWSERSCVWTARDSNLRQNYEPVLTWHKMCISEVSVMANKSIVRHPQAKLLMKQIWHSISLHLKALKSVCLYRFPILYGIPDRPILG